MFQSWSNRLDKLIGWSPSESREKKGQLGHQQNWHNAPGITISWWSLCVNSPVADCKYRGSRNDQKSRGCWYCRTDIEKEFHVPLQPRIGTEEQVEKRNGEGGQPGEHDRSPTDQHQDRPWRLHCCGLKFTRGQTRGKCLPSPHQTISLCSGKLDLTKEILIFFHLIF